MRYVGLILFLLASCAHKKERILSPEEKERLGLTAMIYDAPLCPTSINAETGRAQVDGPCELVTCIPQEGELVCKAVKEKPRQGSTKSSPEAK